MDTTQIAVTDSAPPEAPRRLPFSFAKRHRVQVASIDDQGAHVLCGPGVSAQTLAEVRRYTQTPTQPQSYLMGKLAILELVADYRRAHAEASLRQVHDAILGCGSLPPRLMRQQLGLS